MAARGKKLTADKVAEYLEKHPAFLRKRPELMARALESNASTDNVRDLTGRLVSKLRRENEELRGEREHIIETVQLNERIQNAFHNLEMIAGTCTTFEELISRFTENMEEEFNLDRVVITLAEDEIEQLSDTVLSLESPVHGDRLLAMPRDELLEVLDGGTRPQLKSGNTEDISRFFGDNAVEVIRSQALVPLVTSNRLLGSLNIGSADPERYRTEYGVELLGRLGLKLAAALENLSLREQLIHQTLIDALTNTFNRRYLDQTLEREFQRSERYELPLSCIILDLDRFKEVNDTYGHPAGDEVLRVTSEMLLRRARGVDQVMRYGGDEFLILLPGTDREGAHILSERLRIELAERKFEAKDQVFHMTASFGLATVPHPEIESGEELVAAADAFLLRAKDQGRDQVVST